MSLALQTQGVLGQQRMSKQVAATQPAILLDQRKSCLLHGQTASSPVRLAAVRGLEGRQRRRALESALGARQRPLH